MPQKLCPVCDAWVTFLTRADVAQLAEHWLPKPRVAGSIPVVRFLSGRRGFAPRWTGNDVLMLAVALAAVVVGIVFLFIIPWVGIPVGIAGVLLLGIWLLAVARKSPREAAEEARPR